ncbi:MAG: hypothetical protein Q8O29_10455 [Polaromonas sp.]|uniref:hypothetical protein n=1 Tax=Polaromonas sp. TaxID=1869339 RepID=UPI002734E96E|nr:hypothetical protein [Polaromonas sp.]MDP2818673.1 hypothetical protein [Polaromonas sp.]
MGFGFVVERLDLSDQPLHASQRGFSPWPGVGLLLIGVGVAVVSPPRFCRIRRGLGGQETHAATGAVSACGPTSC